MLRVALTPRWLAVHLLLAAMLLGFVRLGIWQYDSYRGQREGGGSAAVSAAAVPLREVASLGESLRRDGVRVRATGQYDADAQLVVAGVRQGGREGYELVTPLRLEDGSVLVVVRGWAPTAGAASLPAGEVEITGVLGPNDDDVGKRTDATTPAGRLITAVSSEELLRRLPYPPAQVYDGRVILTAQEPAVADGVELLPAQRHRSGGVSAWRNLAYALQWWFFAAAAVWLWVVSLRAAARSAPRLDSGARG